MEAKSQNGLKQRLPQLILPFACLVSGMSIISAESLILILVPEETNIGGMVLEDGWCQLTAQDPNYPND